MVTNLIPFFLAKHLQVSLSWGAVPVFAQAPQNQMDAQPAIYSRLHYDSVF